MAELAVPKPPRDRVDDEELRIGLVLNGGSSLAIWMGGVCTEVDRLRRGEGAYGELLDALETTARVDVIAGTSAGGLNGGLLATAIARGGPLAGLQDLWVKAGNLDDLLRSPFEADPPSLMRGDEYFTKELRRGFGTVADHAHTIPADTVHLTMVTSVLSGQAAGLADDFGGVIPDVTHVGTFSFVRDELGRNDFADDGALDRLALAARSSASFPFVFEPSFCPVDDANATADRPSLRGAASFDANRFTVDGGALINKPFPPALDAIYAQPAARQVRRVLVYVAPDPGDLSPAPPDLIQNMPSIAKAVVDSAMTMPRTESVARELEEIRTHNDCVANVRRIREELLFGDDLVAMAGACWRPYRRQRLAASVDAIVRRIEAGGARGRVQRGGWDRGSLRTALQAARHDLLVDTPPSDTTTDTVTPWRWGIAPVQSMGMTALDLLRRGLSVAPTTEAGPRAELRAARAAIHAHRSVAAIIRDLDVGYWESQSPPAGLDDAGLQAWAVNAFAGWEATLQAKGGPALPGPPLSALAGAAVGIATTLQGTRAMLLQILATATPPGLDGQRTAAALQAGINALLPAEGTSPAAVDACARRLLDLEVALTVFASVSPTCDQLVELMLVSGNTSNAFDQRYSVDDKVAGVKAGHFGAFYKASWRSNDWMFGRLDGAWRLAQVLLSPGRLNQLFAGQADEAFELIRSVACGGADSATDGYLAEPRGEWNPETARHELDFLDTGAQPPKVLAQCARGVARRLQLRILMEELPNVVASVHYDRDLRASDIAGARFLANYPTPVGQTPTPEAAVRGFKACDIGTESLAAEAGYDLFTSTASRIAAVSVNAVGGTRLGLSALNVLIGALKTFVMAFYLLGQAAVRRSRTAFAVTWILLTLGGLVLLLPAVSDVSPPSYVRLPAVMLVLAGLLLACQRAAAPLWVAALLVATAVGVALPLVLIHSPRPDVHGAISGTDAVRQILRLVLAVAALIVVPALFSSMASRQRDRSREKARAAVI